MTLPIMPVTKPADLRLAQNGRLTPCQLTSVTFPGVGHMSLHPTAARAWSALTVACYAATKLSLSGTGCYRSYDQQLSLFNARYTSTYNPAVNVLTSRRTWLGKRWWLRRGMAPVAVPGTSNHGLGIAVDAGWWAGNNLPGLSDIAGVTAKPVGWGWLQNEATKYGWSWELQSEPWHLRYCAGDHTPQAVLDVEAFLAAQA